MIPIPSIQLIIAVIVLLILCGMSLIIHEKNLELAALQATESLCLASNGQLHMAIDAQNAAVTKLQADSAIRKAADTANAQSLKKRAAYEIGRAKKLMKISPPLPNEACDAADKMINAYLADRIIK